MESKSSVRSRLLVIGGETRQKKEAEGRSCVEAGEMKMISAFMYKPRGLVYVCNLRILEAETGVFWNSWASQ